MDVESGHVSRAVRRASARLGWVGIRAIALGMLLACVASSPSLTSAHTPDQDIELHPMRWNEPVQQR
ncbi:MAG: hypothetical protein H0V10_08030 [Geodermatophilaceae bacterium]|nr:hypothetical protein [Geodermatophilaceae bacterium]